MIESLLRGFERRRTTFDQPVEVGRRDDFRHLAGARLIGSLVQIFGAGAGQVDHLAIMKDAGAPERAEDNDFH
jgi:hypothetical protein